MNQLSTQRNKTKRAEMSTLALLYLLGAILTVFVFFFIGFWAITEQPAVSFVITCRILGGLAFILAAGHAFYYFVTMFLGEING